MHHWAFDGREPEVGSKRRVPAPLRCLDSSARWPSPSLLLHHCCCGGTASVLRARVGRRCFGGTCLDAQPRGSRPCSCSRARLMPTCNGCLGRRACAHSWQNMIAHVMWDRFGNALLVIVNYHYEYANGHVTLPEGVLVGRRCFPGGFGHSFGRGHRLRTGRRHGLHVAQHVASDHPCRLHALPSPHDHPLSLALAPTRTAAVSFPDVSQLLGS